MAPLLALLLGLVAHCHAALGPLKCPAELKGWAYQPAGLGIPPPSDSPDLFKQTGRFVQPYNRRDDTLGPFYVCTQEGQQGFPECAFQVPFQNQQLQGYSGIKTLRDPATSKPTDQFWVIADNGFGSRRSSPDCLLMLHLMSVNWANSTFKHERTVFLSDPNKKIPYIIRNEETKERYLTGADLDPESIQFTNSSFWIGDEIGPYLVEFNVDGQAKELYDVPLPPPNSRPTTALVMSPDHDRVIARRDPGVWLTPYNARGGRGMEGLALQGSQLYVLLEASLYLRNRSSSDNYTFETAPGGNEFVRIYKFDLTTRTFANTTYKYVLEDSLHSVNDFQMLDARFGLVTENDIFEGEPSQACAVNSSVVLGCRDLPAAFKRVYLIDLQAAADADGFVKKVAYVDLLDIQDPNGLSPFSKGGVLALPFAAMDAIDVYSKADSTIVAGNDNNFPYSMGRRLGIADASELAVLQAPGLFNGGQGCEPPVADQ